ncbi:uncharacterized protein LOC123550620 isoform X2 [Mercenaria mercenaria]|uniref:uncharacterized protein LOC123550620 isoform X2 n=1 Tax=Mercenaria mercenaria TaxID=6596 RepID=UPI00234F8198|nr:uncharacterized protein LOC123550620 isoform X2 [Mercenaria mercenaria]
MEGGEQTTISPEFLENIQSAVNSQGVLGQVQVIETENGPVTVLFMEEGADASNLGGENITLSVDDAGQNIGGTVDDPNAGVQYQYVETEEDYSQLLQGAVGDTVVSVADTVKEDLAAVQPVIDLPAADQATTETYEQPVGDTTTDTYYITDTGEILKIDSSLLGENAGDATLQLQTADGSLQILNQVGNVQTSQVETQMTYPQSTVDNINITYDQGTPFEYTATKVDNPLVIDTARVEEPKVLSYKTTNRQRTNIMRQPVSKSPASMQSKQTITSQSIKSQTSLLSSQYKTIKQRDSSGITTEVVYPPSYQKQTIVFPKVQKQTPYANVIKTGQQSYQTKLKTAPQQMITTVMNPQSLLKSNVNQGLSSGAVVNKLSAPQIPAVKVTTPSVYTQKQVPAVNKLPAQVVSTQVPAATKQTDLLSVAMKQAEVPEQVLSSVPALHKIDAKPVALKDHTMTTHNIESPGSEPVSDNVSKKVSSVLISSEPVKDIGQTFIPSTTEVQVMEEQTTLELPGTVSPTTIQEKEDTPENFVDSQIDDAGESKMETDEQPAEADQPVLDEKDEDDQKTSKTEKSVPDTSDKQNDVTASRKDGEEVGKIPKETDIGEQLTGSSQTSGEMKSIDVPDSDVTIQLFADGTLVTRDKAGTNYSQVKLEDLGLDLSMLEGNTDIELLIVQGDGKEVRATINTSKDVNPTTESVTPGSKSAPVNTVASAALETKSTSSAGTSTDRAPTAPVNEARPYKCSMCPRTFKFYRTFRCHEIVHTKAVTFTCHLCQRLFAREVNLQSHLELHKKKGSMKPTEERSEHKTEEKNYQCKHCEKTFRYQQGLKRHITEQHEENAKVPCPICGKLFKSEQNVQRHSKIHVGPFTCPHCIKVFTERSEYNDHIKSEHADLMYPCKECDAILPSKKAFVSHVKTQHSNSDELMEGIKDKKCTVCDKKFDKKTDLENHMVIHSAERTQECPACHKKYKLLHTLERHIKDVHNNDVVFTCSECDEEFEVKTKLDLHVKLFHTGNYQCLTCYEEFPERSLLEEHQFQNHDFALVCSKCKGKFETSLKLKNHLKEHTSQNSLCDMCGAGFEHKAQLRTHLVNKHFARDRASMLKQYPGMSNINLEIVCDLCGEFWLNKPLYKQHLRDVHFGGDTVEMLKLFPLYEKVADPPEPVTCDHCGKMCSSVTQLNFHLRTHMKSKRKSVTPKEEFISTDDEQDEPVDFTNIEPRDFDKNYKCQQCGAQFSRKAALEKHASVHKKDELKEALKDLEKEEIARAELEEKEGWKPTPKTKKVRKESLGTKPKETKPVNKTQATTKIKLPFPKMVEKKKNESSEIGLSPKRRSSQLHICKVCEEIFKTTEELTVHMHDDHGDLEFKVEASSPSVERKYTDKDVGKEKIVEFDLKTFQCMSCDKIYSSRKYLRKHLRNVHKYKERFFSNSSESFKCTECDLVFNVKSNMARHMFAKHGIQLPTSENESPTKTPSNKKKTEDDEFESNDEDHTAESSADITAFLGKNFNLGKAHSCNIESVKKKQHRCNLCGEGFSRDATLKKHLAFHNTGVNVDIKPDFDLVSDLQPAIYSCKTCGNMYSTALGLIHHNRNKHAEVDEEVVLAEIAEVDAKLKLESPKKKLEKDLNKSSKRKLESDGEDIRETVKKRVKLDKYGKESFDCKFCGAVYATYKGLMKHEHDIHDADKVMSPQSALKYSHSGRLITKSKKLSEQIQCDKCTKVFLEEKGLKQHILRVHKIEAISKKTGKISSVKTSPDKVNLVKTSGEFKCDLCPKQFDLRINLRRHMKMKHNIELPPDTMNSSPKNSLGTVNLVYHCDVCEQKFSTLSNLRHHMISVHDENDVEVKTEAVICEICNLEFATPKSLEVHMRKHTGEKPYRCCLCNKQFISKYQLECHMKKLHTKLWAKKVKCKICLMLFETEKAMLKHKVTHRKPQGSEEQKSRSEPSQHKCSYCEKSFKWKRNLVSHVETYHKDSDPQTCGVCNKVFPDKESIKAHMLEHQVKKESHTCKVCDKSFQKESSLRMHEAQLHKPKSTTGVGMSCDICKESFPTKIKLLEHMLSHTSVMPHKCDICSASFKQEFRLKAHKLTHKIKDKQSGVKNATDKSKGHAVKGKEIDKNKKEVKPIKYKCKKCSKQFDKIWLLRSHVAKSHKPKIVVKTSLLKGRITRSRSLSETKTDPAKQVSTKEKKLPKEKKPVKKELKKVASNFCKKCNLNFIKTETFELHMKTMHKNVKKGESPKVAKVDQPKKTEKKTGPKSIGNAVKPKKSDKSAKKNMESAVKGKKEMVGHDCPICKKIFSKQFTLKSHIKNVHKVMMEDSPSKIGMKRKKCLYCTECARVFWSQMQYDTHNKRFHPDKSALELDKHVMQAMGSGEIKTEPLDAMSSPKHTEFETIQHKCEFCPMVHWTKKLFDEHMLKEHPEHAEEYGITGDEDTSRPTIEFVNDSEDMMGNLLSVGLYDVSACDKLSSFPVVSIQRINGKHDNTMSPNNEQFTEMEADAEIEKQGSDEDLEDKSRQESENTDASITYSMKETADVDCVISSIKGGNIDAEASKESSVQRTSDNDDDKDIDSDSDTEATYNNVSDRDEYTREYEKFLQNSVIDCSETTDGTESEDDSRDEPVNEDVEKVSEKKETEEIAYIENVSDKDEASKADSDVEKNAEEGIKEKYIHSDDATVKMTDNMPLVDAEDKSEDQRSENYPEHSAGQNVENVEAMMNDQTVVTNSIIEETAVGHETDKTQDFTVKEVQHPEAGKEKGQIEETEIENENTEESDNEKEQEGIDWEAIDNEIEAVAADGNNDDLTSGAELSGEGKAREFDIEDVDKDEETAILAKDILSSHRDKETVGILESESSNKEISTEAKHGIEDFSTEEDNITEKNVEENDYKAMQEMTCNEPGNEFTEQMGSNLLNDIENTDTSLNTNDQNCEILQTSVSENRAVNEVSGDLRNEEDADGNQDKFVLNEVQRKETSLESETGGFESQNDYEEMDTS